jgi:V8-like Glu-specific endopeptidase
MGSPLHRFAVGLGALLAGCAAPSPEAVNEGLIGGTLDDAHPGVVFLQIVVDPMLNQAARCTGTVVSDHVVVTAAHCLTETDLTRYTIFVGQNAHMPTATFTVSQVAADPKFVAQMGHDDGVVISTMPLGLPKIPLDAHTLDSSIAGKSVLLLGYGRTNAGDANSDGQRMAASSPVTKLEGEWLDFNDGAHAVCRGDSGGPSLMMVDGVEQIVGIHSFGDVNCGGVSYDQRVDVALDFFAPFLAADGDPLPDLGTPAVVHDMAAKSGDLAMGDGGSDGTGVQGGCSIGMHGSRGALGMLLALLVFLLVRRRLA